MRTTEVQVEVGSLRGPKRRTQSVFSGHDGIIQAIQDGMRGVDDAIDDDAKM